MILILLGACSDPLVMQPGFVQLSPPDTLVDLSASYRQLHDEVTQCSGVGGEFERIRWFWHPTEDTPMTLNGVPLVGNTKWKTHRIFLGRAAGNNRRIVAHELLHDRLQTNDHPPEYFEGRCKDLVSHGYLQH